MCGDEGQLIAAGKEAKENQRIAWVFEGFHQDLANAFFQLGLAGHPLGFHHRQEDQRANHDGGKGDKDVLPNHKAQQILSQRRTNHLTGRASRGGNGQRH